MRVVILKGAGVIAPHVIDGFTKGFRQSGHEVLAIDISKANIDINGVIAFKPDFVLAYGYNGFCKTSGGFAFRLLQTPLISLHYDCPYFGRDREIATEILNHPDFYYEFVWDDTFLQMLRSEGFVNSAPILLATDEEAFRPTGIEPAAVDPSVCFVGGLNLRKEKPTVGVPIIDSFIDLVIDTKVGRLDVPVLEICQQLFATAEYAPVQQFFKSEPEQFWKQVYYKIHGWGSTVTRKFILDSIDGVPLHVYGHTGDWERHNAVFHDKVPYGTELSAVYQQYALNLNITSLQLEKSINNRPFDAYASKAFMLNDFREDLITAYPAHWEQISFKSLEQFAEKGEYFLTHERERRELVNELYDHTLKHHTYRERANQIVAKLGEVDFFARPSAKPSAAGQELKLQPADSDGRKITVCPLCGSKSFTPMFSRQGHGGYQSNFEKCTDCCLVLLNPCPTEGYLSRFYNDVYFSAEHRKSMGWSPQIDVVKPENFYRYQKRMDFVEKYVPEELSYPRGRLLDVGCSTGGFLVEASLRYWEVTGIEISEKAANVGREKYGLKVVTGVLGDTSFDSGCFDVVSAWDVIEHVASPEGFMANVQRVLKPGGLFILNTPNVNSADAMHAGVNWRHLDAPLHPVLYDYMTIRFLLKKYGFDCLEVSTGDEYPGQMKVAARKL
jgi:spore maturation protein CgeB